jgi:tellurium resistance protein TerD
MSGIPLQKGSRINLAKEAPSLKRVRVGLSWKPNATDSGHTFDLDVTAFGLDLSSGEPKLCNRLDAPDFMVFYNNPTSMDGAIKHSGDNRTGQGDGDDETIIVDLEKLDKRVGEISFIVTIDDAVNRKQNFGQVPTSAITLYDDETGVQIARYNLEEDFSVETAVQFGSLYKRDDGAWGFKAIGTGYKLGLDAFVKGYGGIVA